MGRLLINLEVGENPESQCVGGPVSQLAMLELAGTGADRVEKEYRPHIFYTIRVLHTGTELEVLVGFLHQPVTDTKNCDGAGVEALALRFIYVMLMKV